MSVYKKIVQQTAIYGLATVFPRVLGFLLVPFHTSMMPNDAYGEYTIVFSIMMFCNVVLAFGMETAFFRFYNLREDKNEVLNNSLLYLGFTSVCFLLFGLWTADFWSSYLNIDPNIIHYLIWILVLDALAIIPFARLRVEQRPKVYSVIKIGNVTLNAFLNVFFLYFLPKLATTYPLSFWSSIYLEDFQVAYIFIANLIASLATFLVFYKDYLRIKFQFNKVLWKQMITYGFPVMIAGLAFAINESFDKILLERLHVPLSDIGKYAACYKIGLFMVLFRQAYTLGIEPFFFNYAQHEDAPTKYATITKYFVLFGSLIMLGVVVFADILKLFFIDASYWDAMDVVPLIILANFCLGIYTNLSVWYKLRDKTMAGAYISIVGAILTLVFNYVLIPIWSYMGSAVATLIAYGSMMCISYFWGAKHYPIPYDKKVIGLYLFVSTVLSGIYFYRFRENYFVGAAFILLFCLLIYRCERATIADILLKKKT